MTETLLCLSFTMLSLFTQDSSRTPSMTCMWWGHIISYHVVSYHITSSIIYHYIFLYQHSLYHIILSDICIHSLLTHLSACRSPCYHLNLRLPFLTYDELIANCDQRRMHASSLRLIERQYLTMFDFASILQRVCCAAVYLLRTDSRPR